MTTEYQSHLKEIGKVREEFINILRENKEGDVFERLPKYSKLLGDLKLNFVKSILKDKLSSREEQKIDLSLNTLTDTLLDYTRYSFFKRDEDE